MFDATEERATLEDHLATALTQRYCPICYILSDKTYNLLCQLQYDAVHNAEVRAYVTAAGGYCNFHFWYLEKLTSPVTNAQFLESLLEKIKAEILDHQSTPQGVFTFLTIEARCPVCRTCRIWEEELLALFTAKIPEKGF